MRSEVVVAFRAKFGNSLWCIASGMTNHITKKLQDPWRNNLVVPHFHCLVNVCIMLAFRNLFFLQKNYQKSQVVQTPNEQQFRCTAPIKKTGRVTTFLSSRSSFRMPWPVSCSGMDGP